MRTKRVKDERKERVSTATDGFISAAEAMELLGVTAQTLYAYVSRKGIRSEKIPGTRQSRYWRADVESIKAKGGPGGDSADNRRESEITLLTTDDIYYRGQSAWALSETASLEEVASLLWGVNVDDVFTGVIPRAPAIWSRLDPLVASESQVNRIAVLFPLLEEANPRAYDLSPLGMARTGVDILRWFAAITLHAKKPTAEPIHGFVGRELRLNKLDTDLIRRMLILSADIGLEQATVVVRALASAGVTPWCAVVGGLSVGLGRQSRFGSFDSIHRFVSEILDSASPSTAVVRRVRSGDDLPGFRSPSFAQVDPRAVAMIGYIERAYPGDAAFKRLKEALQTVKEITDAEPNFALVCIYIGIKIGFSTRSSLFHIGRVAGWVAHMIEQSKEPGKKRVSAQYSGLLPHSF